jgi:hypothetical protein
MVLRWFGRCRSICAESQARIELSAVRAHLFDCAFHGVVSDKTQFGSGEAGVDARADTGRESGSLPRKFRAASVARSDHDRPRLGRSAGRNGRMKRPDGGKSGKRSGGNAKKVGTITKGKGDNRGKGSRFKSRGKVVKKG